jgi:phenylalanyl-tRNA synthetase alpha chain
MTDLDDLRTRLTGAVEGAGDLEALEALRVAALGKKGEITERMKGLGKAAPEERKALGQGLNALKDEIAGLIEARMAALGDAAH